MIELALHYGLFSDTRLFDAVESMKLSIMTIPGVSNEVAQSIQKAETLAKSMKQLKERKCISIIQSNFKIIELNSSFCFHV